MASKLAVYFFMYMSRKYSLLLDGAKRLFHPDLRFKIRIQSRSEVDDFEHDRGIG